MYCLGDAFTPTDTERFGAENPWTCEGVADRVYVDERHDLRYRPLRHFREAVGFQIVQEASPALLVRDLAERWSDEMGVEVDTPGDGAATLARWRANMEPLGADRVLLPDLDHKFRRGVVDRYNAQPIPGLERSPLKLWREAAAVFKPRFVPPEAPGQYFRPEAMRPIGPRGVVWRNRTYWSEQLGKLLRNNGPDRTYEVRGDEWAPETVDLYTHERKWIRLACRWV